MRLNSKLWLWLGSAGATLFLLGMFLDVFFDISHPVFGVVSYPAVRLLILSGISHSQPWPLYLLVFGILTNFCFGAAIGYLIQFLLPNRGSPKGRRP